mmetsp:Transcript_66558/g.173188  ORF Transcript_66558/g.173188 Transcript_66558/m.173188 type:complete len:203 (-) Transcript_66558:138-746(-)
MCPCGSLLPSRSRARALPGHRPPAPWGHRPQRHSRLPRARRHWPPRPARWPWRPPSGLKPPAARGQRPAALGERRPRGRSTLARARRRGPPPPARSRWRPPTPVTDSSMQHPRRAAWSHSPRRHWPPPCRWPPSPARCRWPPPSACKHPDRRQGHGPIRQCSCLGHSSPRVSPRQLAWCRLSEGGPHHDCRTSSTRSRPTRH